MSELDYVINNCEISLINEGEKYSIEFPFPIKDAISIGDIIIVRLGTKPGCILNENIFGIDQKLNIKWQITKIEHLYEDSPYTGMIKQGKNVKLSNWDGVDVLVDPESGVIINKGFGK